MAHLLTVATRANLDARHATYAAILAMQKVEELRSSMNSDPVGEDRIGGYRRRWFVGPLPEDPADSVVIDVAVTPGAARMVTVQPRMGQPQ